MIFKIRGNAKQQLDKIARKLNIPREDVIKNALEELYDVVVDGQVREKKSLAPTSSSSLIQNKKEME